MSAELPRMRMFAGPNGSGKSTIKSLLKPNWLGVYINPDEIEKSIRTGPLDFGSIGVEANQNELIEFFNRSPLLKRVPLADAAEILLVKNNQLAIEARLVNSYIASILSDFLRRKMLSSRRSFSFETVMSSRDKVELLSTAKELGYRTYLYYIATEDTSINIDRVRHRVRHGGHNVPEDRIVSRYFRSLELLADAVRASTRAYFFDNSGRDRIWIAEASEQIIELKTDHIPNWFQNAVLDKLHR
jgi:predicted ABC-type ATPase